MEQAASYNQPSLTGTAYAHEQEWRDALPLYIASLVVTLAGVGAVGVTISEPAWTPLWVMLAVVGHLTSAWLRRRRVSTEAVFYPIMLVGTAFVLQQSLIGGPLLGMTGPITTQPIDMATAMVVGMLSVLRTFTLLNNGTLLFSPVPTITMMALVGSTNPNAEVPVFFILSLLGALFITGYETHLRRARDRQPGAHVTFHLLVAWAFTLCICAVALVFPLLVQPVTSQFSPYYWPGVNRLQMMANFMNYNQTQAPVGQGPIRLSPTPVFEVYTPEAGRLRTGVFARYTGRDWRGEVDIPAADLVPTRQQRVRPNLPGVSDLDYLLYQFDVPGSVPDVAVREVRQRIVTRSASFGGVPALGSVKKLWYPSQRAYLHATGVVTGDGHQRPGRYFEIVSRVYEVPPDRLRKVSLVDPEKFPQPEMLDLPNSAAPVSELARDITRGISNPYDQIMAIIGYIEKNCTYTLEEEITPAGVDAAAHYLFSSKRGACDLAATATAVMSRAVGIPARVAVGYVLEEPLETGGGYLVRQAHAHMWVEAYFGEYGWVPFDPAPAAVNLNDNPLMTAWLRVRSLVGKIGGGGLDAILLLGVVLATAGLAGARGWTALQRWLSASRRQQASRAESPQAAIVAQYERALRILRRRGWAREAWMTPREYLADLRAQMERYEDGTAVGGRREETLSALTRLTESVEQAVYAGSGSPEQREAAARALQELSKVAPRRPRTKRSGAVVSPSEGVG